jgi:phosphate transport system ATP-binding protein
VNRLTDVESPELKKEEPAVPSDAPQRARGSLVEPPSEVALSRAGEPEDVSTLPSKVSVKNLNFFYGDQQALFDNNIEIPEKRVTAVIGPSGCGKSTHIRVYNRIYELYRTHRAEGEVIIDGVNVLEPAVDLIDLRKRVGMIFQRPTPFPMSIFDNIAYGLKLHYHVGRAELADRVQDALVRGALWEEVKDKLEEPATALSGGQQQRLCIARAIATEPELILMDEPCSAIDPVATAKIEDLIEKLREDFTVVLVTHNMQQAARVSDFTAFFYKGYIVEFGATKQIFTNPAKKETEDYITGRFG